MTNTIPVFKTIQEEAEFWDTHDTTDFENEMMSIKVSYKPKMDKNITVRFPATDLRRLKVIAHKKGIGVTTLVRMVSRDFLEKQHPQSTS